MQPSTRLKQSLLLLGCLAVLAGPLHGQGYGGSSEPTLRNDAAPESLESVTVDQRLGEQIPLTGRFKDELGRSVRLGRFFKNDRPLIITLNYSNCPMLCSVQLNKLVEGLQDLELEPGKDFEIITISIDPRERPERAAETKRNYLAAIDRPGLANAWHFLTGDAESIAGVASALGFRYHYDRKTQQYFHPAMLAFVSPDGQISRYMLTFPYEADQLKLALVDAGQGTIGSAVDQVILWCANYDPERGQYTASAWKLMKLGGGVTVIMMLGLLLPFWIGRRGKAPPEEGSPGEEDSPAETQHND